MTNMDETPINLNMPTYTAVQVIWSFKENWRITVILIALEYGVKLSPLLIFNSNEWTDAESKLQQTYCVEK